MHSTLFYFILSAFIFGWWTLAFHGSPQATAPSSTLTPLSRPFNLDEIPPLDRALIHRALLGDYALMAQLITDWQLDGYLLQKQGLPAKLLSADDYMHAQALYRQLPYLYETCTATKRLYLPQTYFAASVLLALCSPEEIAALPAGLRKQASLYPDTLTAAISNDIDSYHTEKLFLHRPQLAFISPISNPDTLEALQAQGITLHKVGHLNSLADILAEIRSLGVATRHPEKAELLALFMEAALHAIDNHFLLFMEHKPKKFLYIKCLNGYTVPGKRSLTSQLLARIDLSLSPFQEQSVNRDLWGQPISLEALLQDNPDFMMLATPSDFSIAEWIQAEKALNSLDAVKHSRIACVEEVVQDTLSQHVVLAYFDLCHALWQQTTAPPTLLAVE